MTDGVFGFFLSREDVSFARLAQFFCRYSSSGGQLWGDARDSGSAAAEGPFAGAFRPRRGRPPGLEWPMDRAGKEKEKTKDIVMARQSEAPRSS